MREREHQSNACVEQLFRESKREPEACRIRDLDDDEIALRIVQERSCDSFVRLFVDCRANRIETRKVGQRRRNPRRQFDRGLENVDGDAGKVSDARVREAAFQLQQRELGAEERRRGLKVARSRPCALAGGQGGSVRGQVAVSVRSRDCRSEPWALRLLLGRRAAARCRLRASTT